MSPYGNTTGPPRTASLLPTRIYVLPDKKTSLAVVHLRLQDFPQDLAEYLRSVFNSVLTEGKTYPQQDLLSHDQFAGYFLSYDLFLGIVCDSDLAKEGSTIDDARAGRTWKESIGGFFYVKPNYPGRSSHICNAGFVVPDTFKGLKIGMALGTSYLHFAPQLGYEASVFNLVYVTNKASLAIWDRLGFSRVGLIPEAGRLKTDQNGEEELVDAAVIYKKFDNA